MHEREGLFHFYGIIAGYGVGIESIIECLEHKVLDGQAAIEECVILPITQLTSEFRPCNDNHRNWRIFHPVVAAEKRIMKLLQRLILCYNDKAPRLVIKTKWGLCRGCHNSTNDFFRDLFLAIGTVEPPLFNCF
jgi:hypothetical protein